MASQFRPRMLLLPLAIVIIVAGPVPRADADLIFSNPAPQNNFTSNGGLATTISVTTTVTIGDISINTETLSASSYKFLIYDAANTSAPAYLSDPKAFGADTSYNFKMSDDFAYTLLAGHTYYIGAISSVQTRFALDSTPATENGLTSVDSFIGVSNFNSPTAQPLNTGVEGEIRLYSASSVPEPSSVALCVIAGLVGLVAARMRVRPATR